MPTESLQPALDLEPRDVIFAAARDLSGFTPWPRDLRDSELGRAVGEAVAALLHLGYDQRTAEQLPRLIETAVLASSAGPDGIDLLESIDRSLVRMRGRDHGLLDGRYA